MTEQWKPVNGYEGIYEVSSLGRVRSLSRYTEQVSRWGTIQRRWKEGRIMTQRTLHGGYLGVLLKKQGNPKMVLVHRLVAQAFVPNPDGMETVNHRDENKQNNRADNLEWMSRGDNVRYGTGSQRKRRDHTAVAQYGLHGNLIQEYASIKEAAEKTGISPSSISKCIRGVHGNVTAGGFKWERIYPVKQRKKRSNSAE